MIGRGVFLIFQCVTRHAEQSENLSLTPLLVDASARTASRKNFFISPRTKLPIVGV